MAMMTINILIPSFNEAMYKNYVALHLNDYHASFLESKALAEGLFDNKNEYELYFCELKKFFALHHLYSNEPCGMVNKKIDSLWHQFILFTREYHHFCSAYFGKFIHHSPSLADNTHETAGQKEKIGAENFFRLYFMTFGTPHDLWFSDDGLDKN